MLGPHLVLVVDCGLVCFVGSLCTFLVVVMVADSEVWERWLMECVGGEGEALRVVGGMLFLGI